MKRYLILVLLAIFAAHTSNAQNSCSTYYPLVDGANFQYTNYDKKGRVTRINEDKKFGRIKPLDVLKFIEKKRIYQFERGKELV